MEFAIHNSLPLYAGGLGILAGDHCKEASDLGLPLIGLGFMYPQRYFQQHIIEDGWQEEIYRQIDFANSPIAPVLSAQRQPIVVRVDLDSRAVYVAVWQVNVGRVKLFLLDSHLEQNCPNDRELSARLYGGNSEMRLQQEIVLGIGGVRVLRELKINPSVWHANEGHTSFMMLERCREFVEKGLNFNQALLKVQNTTIFTTHTPVPAGNDVFSHSLIEKYFSQYWPSLGLNRDAFLNLGTQNPEEKEFNMTVLGLRTSNYRNGVSKLHGITCRRMWHSLWPDLDEKDVPINSITNGIHVPTLISPQMGSLFEKHLGNEWLCKHDDPSTFNNVEAIPDKEIWEARRWLKTKLINALQNRSRKSWSCGGGSPTKALANGVPYWIQKLLQ
jgi:glycogen phosphorylase